jgi:predicted amidophosphoribosyltransferase
MYDRLTQIDDLTRSDHHYLELSDVCLYFGEYTAREGYSFSDTNQLIFNFKKSVDRKDKPEYIHKRKAIKTVVKALEKTVNPESITIIPTPPSKHKSHPEYDNRLSLVLKAWKNVNANVDYREIIIQNASLQASHENSDRPSPNTLQEHYEITLSETKDLRETLVVFDDVITTGSHFKAMQAILRKQFPNHEIAGVFIARRVPETIDPIKMFEDIKF